MTEDTIQPKPDVIITPDMMKRDHIRQLTVSNIDLLQTVERLRNERDKDLADVDRFRGMARTYMDERDTGREIVRALISKLDAMETHDMELESCRDWAGGPQNPGDEDGN